MNKENLCIHAGAEKRTPPLYNIGQYRFPAGPLQYNIGQGSLHENGRVTTTIKVGRERTSLCTHAPVQRAETVTASPGPYLYIGGFSARTGG